MSVGKQVQLVCSTGISCEVYAKEEWPLSNAIVLNTFFGIGITNGSFQKIVDEAVDKCSSKLSSLDVVLWDEFSMNSSRDLELIHCICSIVRKSNLPFGGIQFILIGDWLQLSPIPDNIYVNKDNAKMYKSPIFGALLCHSIELDIIFRQENYDANDTNFRKVLDDLRSGQCSEESEKFINDVLANQLENQGHQEVVDICFTRMEADFLNACKLRVFDGQAFAFDSEDIGTLARAQEVVPKRVLTKPGAPMICLANINNRIHNGTRCNFVSKIDNNSAEIEVGGVRHIVEKWRWNNSDRRGAVRGSRKQIPLKLNWACTVHKSQGSQLPKVIIHSDYEFTSGMLYVAASRVRSYRDLQVINFSKNHLKSRNEEIQEIHNLRFANFIDDVSCCRNEVHCSEPHEILPGADNLEESAVNENIWYTDVAREFVQDNIPVTEDDKILHLEIVLENLEQSEDDLDQPPLDLNYENFLTEMKDISILRDAIASQNKNRVIDTALASLPKTVLFIKILWKKIFIWLKRHINDNLSDTIFTTAFLKDVTRKVWFVSRDESVRSLLLILLSGQVAKAVLEEADIGFCSDVALKVYYLLLEVIARSVRRNIATEASASLKVAEMDNPGLAKIRYLAGYLIHELLSRAKRYVTKNIYSEGQQVTNNVDGAMKKIKLLKQNIMVSYENISSTTKYRETLAYVERRQYACNGLLHIVDALYEFMLKLEQARVNHLKISHCQTFGEKFLFEVKKTMMDDTEFNLKQSFDEMFENGGNICLPEQRKVCEMTLHCLVYIVEKLNLTNESYIISSRVKVRYTFFLCKVSDTELLKKF